MLVLYNTIVDQATDHFQTGIQLEWDYDIAEQRKSILQKNGFKGKRLFFQGMSEMRQNS